MADKPLDIRHADFVHSEYRAHLYLNFLRMIASSHCADLDTIVGMYVGDGAYENPAQPVFSFQKLTGNPSLLLPDIGLIQPNFLGDHAYADPFPYDSKSTTAFFAGSTTGGATVTADSVRQKSLPRIRAAFYFQNINNVNFYLPNIVQYDSDEALNLLKAAGFGGGEKYSWHDQFRHKFLISMDGNGPSPARIAVGMQSNSILLHYESPHLLHYFFGMQPWLHYIPVEHDADVLGFLEMEEQNPGTFEYITIHGRRFVEDYLNPAAVAKYTADLLRGYDAMFSGSRI